MKFVWSKSNANVFACGDINGEINLWDARFLHEDPIQNWKAHSSPITGVNNLHQNTYK